MSLMSIFTAFVFVLLPTAAKLAGVLALCLLVRCAIWMFDMVVIAPRSDPLKDLPGPIGGLFESHFRHIMDPNITPEIHNLYVKIFGKTLRFQGFGRHDYRLLSLDFRTVAHVLNSPLFEKPWQTRAILSKLLGRGTFTLEGAEHKFQRRLLGPAFTTKAVRALAPVILEKAEELAGRIDALLSPSPSANPTQLTPPPTPSKPVPASGLPRATIDMVDWLSRAAFDVIGLAGFAHSFDALADPQTPPYAAHRTLAVLQEHLGGRGAAVLALYAPWLDRVWPDRATREMRRCLGTLAETGRRIIENKRTAVRTGKSNTGGKDILSLLVKSNLSSDPSKRLTNEDLLTQLTTFLFAGADTTALALAWAVHHLAQRPAVQQALRDELTTLAPHPCDSGHSAVGLPTPPASPTVSAFHPTFSPASACAYADALDALPLLDGVVRETLRLSPPVHGTIRVATADTAVPVSAPVCTRDGDVRTREVEVRKGSYVHVPIEGLNTAEDVWGWDAREFNPARWTHLPTSARAPAHPGLANLMTFSLGPHACPGYRLALLEMKLVLAALVPRFRFASAPAPPSLREGGAGAAVGPELEDVRIVKRNGILTRPYVLGREDEGSMLPVLVERVCA